MATGSAPSQELFVRWLWLVYLPLGLLGLLLLLFTIGILPGWGILLLTLLGAYSVVPLRLLIERRRSGLGGTAPKSVVFGLAAITGLAVLGIILFVMGMERLTSSLGLGLALVGGFLMILSVTVPTFRLVDMILGLTGRVLGKAMTAQKGENAKAPAKAVRPAARYGKAAQPTARNAKAVRPAARSTKAVKNGSRSKRRISARKPQRRH